MIDLLFSVLPQVHGGGNHHGGGIVKGLESFLTFIESMSSMSPAEIFAAIMPGVSSINNIHPLLVHFPIALFSIFFLADTIGGLMSKPNWRKFATPVLYIATFSSILTVVAGFRAAYQVPHNDVIHAIMLRHQAFGITVTVLALILSLRRWFGGEDFLQKKTFGHFALSLLLFICLALGTDLGGLMVYQYGVAVAPVMQQEKHDIDYQHKHEDSINSPHSHNLTHSPD